ncbi:hypothetical protein [Nocardia brasiliensis]|uniref:hypothetical protein n=1 Tax=Nocardia brasiliensis TaxID=37326 RepID=UPI0033C4228C
MWEDVFNELSTSAARQHGLITTAQANRLGADREMLEHFKGFGLIRELDWSVFQLSSSSYGIRFALPYAAWLALENESFRWERTEALHEDAVLSHESACALWGIGATRSSGMRFTAQRERSTPRAVAVTAAPLTPDDVTVHEGVPVTTPHRTIMDLISESTAGEEISRVFTDALVRDLVDLRLLYEDTKEIAAEFGLPTGGRHFIDRFLPGLSPESLSTHNLRTYAELRYPEQVSEVRAQIDKILFAVRGGAAVGDERVSREIAAEIVGRTR